MKQIITSIVKNIKSMRRGSSLAEFAVTTALMATLAATAAPKLSELTETGRLEKSYEDIDKIIQQAGIFYQEKADIEGRGRFPNQAKFNQPVGGADYDNHGGLSTDLAHAHTNSAAHTQNILNDLGLTPSYTDGWKYYDDTPSNQWVSVFGDYDGTATIIATGATYTHDGTYSSPPTGNEWYPLFGDETLSSPYQDGHYAYTIVAGGGTGDDVYPPVIYVVDIENATELNNVLEP